MSLSNYPSVIKGLTFTVTKTPEFNTIVQASPNLYETRVAQSSNPIWHWIFLYDYLYAYYTGSPNNTYPNIPWNDYATLQGFFLQQMGKYGAFLFNDPDDNYVGPGILTTAWSAKTKYWVGASILDSGNHWQQVTAVSTGISGATVPSFNHSGSNTSDGGVTWIDRGSGFSGGVPNNGGGYFNGLPNPPAILQLLDDGAGHYYSPIQRNFGGQFYEDITNLNGSIIVYVNGSVASGYTIVGPGLAINGYSWAGLVVSWDAAAGTWSSTHGYSLGNQVLDPAGHVQQVTTAGTSGSTQPAWNDSGSTTSDGSVVWQDEGYAPAPSLTGPITCNFNFYFQCRFEEDTQDFEKWLAQVWGIGDHGKNGSGTLKIMSSRPPTS